MIACAAIYQCSYELFMKEYITGLAAQDNVLSCYVAIVTSEERK
jgi:hypothetical protein